MLFRSVGTWRLEVSDEFPGTNGNILSASLTVYGVPIVDTDADGLDDNWELARFGSLAQGPRDDRDGDGFSNAMEQILRTDPLTPNGPLRADLSLWNEQLARVSWPSAAGRTNVLRFDSALPGSFTPTTNLVTRFPETEFFIPYTNLLQQFFRIQTQ